MSSNPDDLSDILNSRRSAARYNLGQRPWMISVAEHLLTILRSPLKATILNLLSELATLVGYADANRAVTIDEGKRGSIETPIPRFDPAWAAKRLEQINTRLWVEYEDVAAFNNRPRDPDLRRGVCDSCGHWYAREDICCRWCGRQLHQIDQIRSGR